MKKQNHVKGESGWGVMLGVQPRLVKKVTFEQRPQGIEGGRQEVFLAEGTTGEKA